MNNHLKINSVYKKQLHCEQKASRTHLTTAPTQGLQSTKRFPLSLLRLVILAHPTSYLANNALQSQLVIDFLKKGCMFMNNQKSDFKVHMYR